MAATLVIALIFSSAYAQERTIEGVIKGKGGEPVAAASIAVKDTKAGTATDADGKFRLILPAALEKPVLVISALNYQTTEVRLSAGQQTLELVLEQKKNRWTKLS
ncbi:MAG: carboxypeptidase-like regulatory domain-containing protein [Flavihumibacter sp.]